MEPNNIVLVGGSGVGKSAVGYQLAHLLGKGFVDTDAEIEKVAGRPVGTVFQDDGEEAFREAENKVILGLEGVLNHVIAIGAGALENEENLSTLRALGPWVWLKTDLDVVCRMLLADELALKNRPLLSPVLEVTDLEDRAKKLLTLLKVQNQPREALYEQAAFSLAGGFATPEATAIFISRMLAQPA